MAKRKTFADYGRLGGLKGGKSTSKRKAAAARANGQKGGWPKGKARKVKKGEPMKMNIGIDLASGPDRTVYWCHTCNREVEKGHTHTGTPRKGKGKR